MSQRGQQEDSGRPHWKRSYSSPHLRRADLSSLVMTSPHGHTYLIIIYNKTLQWEGVVLQFLISYLLFEIHIKQIALGLEYLIHSLKNLLVCICMSIVLTLHKMWHYYFYCVCVSGFVSANLPSEAFCNV